MRQGDKWRDEYDQDTLHEILKGIIKTLVAREIAQQLDALAYRGPKLGSQHSHGNSQPLITPVPMNLTATSDLHEIEHKQCIHMHLDTHTNIYMK